MKDFGWHFRFGMVVAIGGMLDIIGLALMATIIGWPLGVALIAAGTKPIAEMYRKRGEVEEKERLAKYNDKLVDDTIEIPEGGLPWSN
jgi:hypothetical protein